MLHTRGVYAAFCVFVHNYLAAHALCLLCRSLGLVRGVLLVLLEFGLKGEGIHAHLLYHGEQAI